ncbi:MAG: hypothetical protein GQ530_01860 [Desulfuromonadales bacterium]|nr:hypothetical protein [Desulfuromonadales bacterium]
MKYLCVLFLLFAPVFTLLLVFATGTAIAGEADVIAVEVTPTGKQTDRFDVTVRHDDSSWEHYANSWEILAPDGSILATRVLAHPHINEQPFTRSLSGVKIPAGTNQVKIRAHDSVHAFGGETMVVDLN